MFRSQSLLGPCITLLVGHGPGICHLTLQRRWLVDDDGIKYPKYYKAVALIDVHVEGVVKCDAPAPACHDVPDYNVVVTSIGEDLDGINVDDE